MSRLLVYAEIHNYDDHDFGTFSTPRRMMPYTYRQLQEWIIERRRQQQSNAAECSSRELVQTADDLAAKLRAFAAILAQEYWLRIISFTLSFQSEVAEI